jgi:hypothetical protein
MQSFRTRAGSTQAQFGDIQWNLFRPLIIRWSKVQILAGPPMFSISCGDPTFRWLASGCV